MISCYVIDDEAHAVEILCDLINATPGLYLQGSTLDPLVGLELLTSGTAPQLTFVDINMPGLSGITLAGLVRTRTKIVFTTAYAQFAVEAFEKEAFDYLLKPVLQERFLSCISRYKKELSQTAALSEKEHFYVKGETKGKITRVNVKDILYIEGALNYIIIHTSDEKRMITYLTLGEVMAYLPTDRFSRVHRSYIVSDDKIQCITGNELSVGNRSAISIGNAYKDAFLKKIELNLLITKRSL